MRSGNLFIRSCVEFLQPKLVMMQPKRLVKMRIKTAAPAVKEFVYTSVADII